MNLRTGLLALLLPCCLAAAQSPGLVDPLRGNVAIPDATKPPRLANNVNDDQRLHTLVTRAAHFLKSVWREIGHVASRVSLLTSRPSSKNGT